MIKPASSHARVPTHRPARSTKGPTNKSASNALFHALGKSASSALADSQAQPTPKSTMKSTLQDGRWHQKVAKDGLWRRNTIQQPQVDSSRHRPAPVGVALLFVSVVALAATTLQGSRAFETDRPAVQETAGAPAPENSSAKHLAGGGQWGGPKNERQRIS